MGWPLVIAVIALIAISIAMRPSPPEQKPQAIDGDKVPKAEEGSPIPVPFGTVMVESPNVVWYGDPGYSPVKSGGDK